MLNVALNCGLKYSLDLLQPCSQPPMGCKLPFFVFFSEFFYSGTELASEERWPEVFHANPNHEPLVNLSEFL